LALCFDPQHNSTKELQRNKGFLVEFLGFFSGKMTTNKMQKSKSNVPSNLKKGQDLHEKKRKIYCLPVIKGQERDM